MSPPGGSRAGCSADSRPRLRGGRAPHGLAHRRRRDAHYVKHDVPATLAILVADHRHRLPHGAKPRILASRRGRSDGLVRPHHIDAVIAGALCGVAFSTHYYAIFLPFGAAARAGDRFRPRPPMPRRSNDGRDLQMRPTPERATVTRPADRRDRPSGTAPRPPVMRWWRWPPSPLPSSHSSPFILVEPRTALADIIANRQIVVGPRQCVRERPDLAADAPTRRCCGATGWRASGSVCRFPGSWWWRAVDRGDIILASFPLAFFLFISNTVPASRYLNPVLPFTALFAGVAIAGLARAVASLMSQGRGGRPGSRRVADASGMGGGRAHGADRRPDVRGSILTGRFFAQDDTRRSPGASSSHRFPMGVYPDSAATRCPSRSRGRASSRR